MKCVAFLLLLIPLTPLSALLIGQPGDTRNPPTITPPPQPKPPQQPPDTEQQKQKTIKELNAIHENFETEFAITPGNGMSRRVEIQRHYLRDKSIFAFKIGGETWRIENFDLIGMLSAAPRIYTTPVLTDANKTKSEIRKLARLAKPREADRFEGDALGQVSRTGTLVTDIGSDEIRMVGALHATADCLKCHSERVAETGKTRKIEVGDVLGAFTYRLTRVNPATK